MLLFRLFDLLAHEYRPSPRLEDEEAHQGAKAQKQNQSTPSRSDLCDERKSGDNGCDEGRKQQRSGQANIKGCDYCSEAQRHADEKAGAAKDRAESHFWQSPMTCRKSYGDILCLETR